jgi:energy-converting hydrogenase Eha subunit F
MQLPIKSTSVEIPAYNFKKGAINAYLLPLSLSLKQTSYVTPCLKKLFSSFVGLTTLSSKFWLY